MLPPNISLALGGPGEPGRTSRWEMNSEEDRRRAVLPTCSSGGRWYSARKGKRSRLCGEPLGRPPERARGARKHAASAERTGFDAARGRPRPSACASATSAGRKSPVSTTSCNDLRRQTCCKIEHMQLRTHSSFHIYVQWSRSSNNLSTGRCGARVLNRVCPLLHDVARRQRHTSPHNTPATDEALTPSCNAREERRRRLRAGASSGSGTCRGAAACSPKAGRCRSVITRRATASSSLELASSADSLPAARQAPPCVKAISR